MLVPVGRRFATGIALGPDDVPHPGDLKPIIDVLDAGPFLPPPIVDLALWIAGELKPGATIKASYAETAGRKVVTTIQVDPM